MKKKITHLKDGKETVSWGECNNIHLPVASKYIEKFWWEIIKDVYSYERARNAGLQEVHKIFTDDRILAGLELYKNGKVDKDIAITDVDIRAKIEGEEGTYTVILKNWKPEKLLRHRHEIEQYIAELYSSCNCLDCQINGHYRNNSTLYCKHLCGVLWLLMEKYNMPKFFIRPEEQQYYQKSNNLDLVKNLKCLPMKKFTPHLNVVALREFRDIPTSLSLSIHRIPNKGYEKDYPNGIPNVWITLTEPDDVEKLIKANIKGLVEMLASRKNTAEQINETVKNLVPNGYEDEIKELKEKIVDLEKKYKEEVEKKEVKEEVKEKTKGNWSRRLLNEIIGWFKT